MEVWGQAAPKHIGSPTPGHGYEKGDPYADFLPPAIEVALDDENPPHRAVAIVRANTPKDGQRYLDPLLVLTGAEYARMSFSEIHGRICDALRGDKPRLIMEVWGPGGARAMFGDGSSRVLDTSKLAIKNRHRRRR